MARIIQHQVEFAEAMTQLSFEQAEAQQRWRPGGDARGRRQALGWRDGNLNDAPGQRNLLDKGWCAVIGDQQHQETDGDHRTSSSRSAFLAAALSGFWSRSRMIASRALARSPMR